MMGIFFGILLAGLFAGVGLDIVISRVPRGEPALGITTKMQRPFVILGNALLWVGCAVCFPDIRYALTMGLASSILICIFWIDLQYMLIYNRFTIILGILGCIALQLDTFTEPVDHLRGLEFGGGIFFLLYFGAFQILKREGIGFGDVKLAAALGLLLGWQRFLFSMLLGSILGSIVLVALSTRKGRGREYPFGPFMVVGALFGMFFGAPMIEWYINLLLG